MLCRAVKPGEGRSAKAETTKSLESAQENLLGRILRLISVSKPKAGEPLDPVLMLLNQMVEGFEISLFEFLYQLLITDLLQYFSLLPEVSAKNLVEVYHDLKKMMKDDRNV